MTSDTRTLTIWGAAAGAVTIIALAWVLIRGSSLSDARERVKTLSADYAKAQSNGTRLDSQIQALQRAAQDQTKALEQAAGTLVPELKPEYQVTDLTSGANRVATDLKALRQRADRTRVALPGSLPLEGGLDPDESARQLQLAQLWLYRLALDTVMDAGVTRIATVTPGRAWSDPSGTYAILTADLDLDAPYEALQATLQALLAGHRQGLGLRALALTPNPAKADGPLRAKLTVSLLTANRAAWKLIPDKAPVPPAVSPKPAAKPAATPTAAATAAPKPVTAGAKPGLGDD
jgi:hypothetical protein